MKYRNATQNRTHLFPCTISIFNSYFPHRLIDFTSHGNISSPSFFQLSLNTFQVFPPQCFTFAYIVFFSNDQSIIFKRNRSLEMRIRDCFISLTLFFLLPQTSLQYIRILFFSLYLHKKPSTKRLI